MADYTITIPANILNRVIDGVAYNNKYRDEIEDENGDMIPNPESKVDFAKRMNRRWIRSNVSSWESKNAGATAIAEADLATEPITAI